MSSSDIEIFEIDSSDGSHARQFINLPLSLYGPDSLFVPRFRSDVKAVLAKSHPFFDHSKGSFFLARRNGKAVGRIAALENRNFNRYHTRKDGRFYFFDCEDSPETADRLFSAAAEWARSQGLEQIVGPQGFSGLGGGGVLVDGFENPPSMTMMPYNHRYYARLIESFGFVKQKDFYSAWIDGADYKTPPKIARISEISRKRGHFKLLDLKNRRNLARAAIEIGRVFNESWKDHEEYCPLTDREIRQLQRNLILVSDPSLIKILVADDRITGFCLTFPDLTEQLRKAHGKLSAVSLPRILRAKKTSRRFIVNGIGILPEHRNSGGTAMLYHELENTLRSRNATGAEMTQIAETTDLMLNDLHTLGGRIYKTHRVYRFAL